MAIILLEEGEPLEKGLKRFKRMIEKEAIIREWRRREYYEKPSTIKARKIKALIRKQAKKIRKNQRKNY